MTTIIQLKLTVNVIEHIDEELTLLINRNIHIDTLRELHKTRELLVNELMRLVRILDSEQKLYNVV
jgi:hypothetical protein